MGQRQQRCDPLGTAATKMPAKPRLWAAAVGEENSGPSTPKRAVNTVGHGSQSLILPVPDWPDAQPDYWSVLFTGHFR